jgi:hypothetical protein
VLGSNEETGWEILLNGGYNSLFIWFTKEWEGFYWRGRTNLLFILHNFLFYILYKNNLANAFKICKLIFLLKIPPILSDLPSTLLCKWKNIWTYLFLLWCYCYLYINDVCYLAWLDF